MDNALKKIKINDLIKFSKLGIKVWLSSKLAKWLFTYIKNAYNYRDLPRWPSLPFIGHLITIGSDGATMLKAVAQMSDDFTDKPVFLFWRGLY